MNAKRFVLEYSDERRRDGLLRTAFMKIVDGFGRRPEPATTWNETATGDVTPWRTLLFVPVIRKAILEAVQSGDKQLIAQTVEASRAFCHELEADFVSLAPSAEETSIIADALAETSAEGPANEVEMALVQNPCPTSAEKAIGPLSKQLASLTDLVTKCRKYARQPQMRRAL